MAGILDNSGQDRQFLIKSIIQYRAVKKFFNSRLIMNSRWLWNLHQRHKFLRAKASRDILKFRVSKMAFLGVFKMFFHRGHHIVSSEYTRDREQCHQMSPAFHDIARVKRFTDLNLFKFYSKVLIFCLQLW